MRGIIAGTIALVLSIATPAVADGVVYGGYPNGCWSVGDGDVVNFDSNDCAEAWAKADGGGSSSGSTLGDARGPLVGADLGFVEVCVGLSGYWPHLCGFGTLCERAQSFCALADLEVRRTTTTG